MFICGICNLPSEPREKAKRVVTQTREVTFPHRYEAHKYTTRDGREIVKDDPGGTGTQIVKEVLAHAACVDKVA